MCNETKSCANVYTNEGKLLHSFGCDEDGVKKLKGPCDVCVSGQYVYVSNWDGHNISVFTTQGQYVTSFGQQGMGEGKFYHHWGVCVNIAVCRLVERVLGFAESLHQARQKAQTKLY